MRYSTPSPTTSRLTSSFQAIASTRATAKAIHCLCSPNQYAQSSREYVDRPDISPAVRDLVKQYFQDLQSGQ